MLFITQGFDAHLGAGGVEDPQHHLFAPQRRQGIHSEVDGALLGQVELDPAILRHPALGDVELGHDLEAGGQPRGHGDRRFVDFIQHAVLAKPHPVDFFIRLKVDVGCATIDGLQDDLVDESHYRRIFGVGLSEGFNLAAAVTTFGAEIEIADLRIGHR
jgi:hypothetical protein